MTPLQVVVARIATKVSFRRSTQKRALVAFAFLALIGAGSTNAGAQEALLSCPSQLGGEELVEEKLWIDEASSIAGQESDGAYVVPSFRKVLCVYYNTTTATVVELNTVDVLWFSTDHADYTFACHEAYEGDSPPSDYVASPTHYVEGIIRTTPQLAAEARALAERLVVAAEPLATRCGEPPTTTAATVVEGATTASTVTTTSTTLVEDTQVGGNPADNSSSSTTSLTTAKDEDLRPEPTQAPSDEEPSEEALLIAAGLILLLLTGGVTALTRPRRKPHPPGESVGDIAARGIAHGFMRWFTPDQALERLGITKPRPQPTPVVADAENNDKQSPDTHQVDAEPLQRHFADMVTHRAEEGYHVRNRTLVEKVWNSARDPFWNDPSSGQCGEYAEWGEEWTRGFVRDQFGNDVVVDTIVVEEASTLSPNGLLDHADGIYRANHAATRVILPDGSRHVLDFWDALGRSRGQPPQMVAEADWVAKWKAEIGEGVVDRPEAELTLKNFVEHYGSVRGLEAYRRSMLKEGKQALGDLLIRSWEKLPW